MSELHSKTFNPRDKFAQTSYNPQSQLKFQMNETGKSFKRKTTAQRYKQVANRKTIDLSDLQSGKKHKRFSSTVVQKKQQFHPLPQIRIPKNKRGPKKASFLQSWLNQALDNQGGIAQSGIDKNQQTLSSVKNYELDKKFLRTQNVSEEVINRMYKSLYVYTHGINALFEQISKLAQTKSPYDSNQKGSTKIIQIFWKAFTKLLQNQTNYKTTFQIIQKKHIQNIEIIKYKISNVAQEYQKQLKQKNIQIQRLERQIQFQYKNFGQLQIDLKVSAATLELTDEAFNDEVQLRLKFQQKINAVYTTYEEMKEKYQRLVKQFKIKGQLNAQQQYNQRLLKEEIRDLTIKSEELIHLHKMQKAKVQDRQTDIIILKEELKTKAEILMQIQHSQAEVQQFKDKSTNRYKLIQAKFQEVNYELSSSKTIIKQQEVRINTQQQRIKQLMEVNNELFTTKLSTYNRNTLVEENILQVQKKVAQVEAENKKLIQRLNQVSQKLKVQIKLKEDLIQIKDKQSVQISEKVSLINMKTQIIQQLKTVKDKYEMLNAMLNLDKKQLYKNVQNLMQSICAQQTKYLLSEKVIAQSKQEHQISQRKNKKDKQIYKKRITQLNDTISKKQDNIMYYVKLMEAERDNVKQREQQIKFLNLKLEEKEKYILDIKNQRLQVFSKLPKLEKEMTLTTEIINSTKQKCQQMSLLKQSMQKEMEATAFLLKAKQEEVSVQNQGLKQLLEYYKNHYLQCKDYIHPMIVEDYIGQCIKIQSMFQNQERKHQQTKQSVSLIQRSYEEKFNNLNQQKLKLLQRSEKLNNQVLELIEDKQALKQKNVKQQKNSEQLKHRIQQFRHMIQKIKEQKRNEQQKLAKFKEQSQEQVKKLQKANDVVRLDLNKKIISLLQERKQLSKDFQKFKRQNLIKNTLIQVKKQQEIKKIQQKKHIQTTTVQVQTQQIHKVEQVKKCLADIETQTIDIKSTQMKKRQTMFESKQIKKQLISIEENQQKQFNNEQMNMWKQQYVKQMDQEKLQQNKKQLSDKKHQQIKNDKDSPTENKIQSKDFKRALKLTFMRR